METDATSEYSYVVDSLVNMFGNVLSQDAIVTVVESCGGDLNISADAVMRIISDTNSVDENAPSNSESQSMQQEKQPETKCLAPQNMNITTDATAPASYATRLQTTGAIPKQQIKPTKTQIIPTGWSEQFCRIVCYHNQGFRVLLLMRGAPGSGKSHLAARIIETTIGSTFADLKTHICSTDDYFGTGTRYNFNRADLPYAHTWNQNRASVAMQQGLSPVIIDNTNIEIWEMEPYVRMGVANGYLIEVVEPSTPWAKRPNQLCRRNVHNVPIASIRRMLDNYIEGITGEFLIKKFGLMYPADKVPPVIRSMPVFNPTPQIPDNPNTPSNKPQEAKHHRSVPTVSTEQQVVKECDTTAVANRSLDGSQIIQPVQGRAEHMIPTTIPENISIIHTDNSCVQDSSSNENTCPAVISHDDENKDDVNTTFYEQIQKQLDEIEKVEQEWEKGENWVEEQKNSTTDQSKSTDKSENTTPKPQRKTQTQTHSGENLLENVGRVQDWRQIAMFMPPWDVQDASTSQLPKPTEIAVQTLNSSTCMEMGDTENYDNMLKVLTASPRDINKFNFAFNKEKIPQKRMLDKSTMTNEHLHINSTNRCQSEEKHFKELRKLFKHVSKIDLREIFDKCMGDVNWAVEIVMDGMASNELKTIESEDISEEEENAYDNDDQCSCLAAYNILPDKSLPQPSSVIVQPNEPSTPTTANENSPKLPNQRKTKKETNTTEDSMNLKRLIENNVGFSQDHYSQHCLKIRNFRHGENDASEEINNGTALGANPITETGYQDIASCLSTDDETNMSVDEVEKTVVVNLGREFVHELDMLFGRRDMTYPDKVLPKISIPQSLLNEINALWMESLMHQLDEHDKQSAIMLKEDEEFARKLALKEAELASAGKEPEVPDFKEIMDMDLALSLYQKDVAEWRNRVPNDLAAKLTRDKLNNLFPDVAKDILSELLMAHDNNFQTTVEVLLMSTGKAEILEQKNGLNKFVMQKEMERQERILEEERKALSEVEWPLLPRGEVVEMSVVDKYREKAERHLVIRNLNHQKANDYVRRGMIQAANHYSEIANHHKMMYEQANSMAAVSLMQVHASKCPDSATIDLHYLRVAEAKEALDLFIDYHIQRLREDQGNSQRSNTLFFITGRGLHSNGQPRIKPAVKHRLRERGLTFSERNPGLLTTRVCVDDKLTYQMS